MARAKTQDESTVQVRFPGEMERDQALADRVVAGLREIHLRKGLEYYLELGDFLIQEMFGGDHRAFHKRQEKHVTFRSLAQREDLPMSYVTLHQAVKVREQYEALPERVRDALTYSHHRALLTLRNEQTKAELASSAVKKSWTVEQLKKAVKNSKDAKGRGRKALPRFQKTLNLFKREIQKVDAFEDTDQIAHLDQEQVKELHKTVLSLKLKCQDLQEKLQAHTPGFTEEE